MRTLIAAIVVTLIGVAVEVKSQTWSERLQRGIYLEETVGDLTAAIATYKEILAAPGIPQQLSMATSERLDRALAKQGDASAMRITALRQRDAESRQPLGVVRYRNAWTGIEFQLPEGWRATATGPSSDDGEIVSLEDTRTGRWLSAWMIREATAPENVHASLSRGPDVKVQQRRGAYGSFQDYEIGPDSVRWSTIGGNEAIRAVGTFRLSFPDWIGFAGTGGRLNPRFTKLSEARQDLDVVEPMTWIYTEHAKVFFFGKVPAIELEEFQSRIEPIIQSAVVP